MAAVEGAPGGAANRPQTCGRGEVTVAGRAGAGVCHSATPAITS